MNQIVTIVRPQKPEAKDHCQLLSLIENRNLRSYCVEQIASAKTKEELSAAITLVEEIAWANSNARMTYPVPANANAV